MLQCDAGKVLQIKSSTDHCEALRTSNLRVQDHQKGLQYHVAFRNALRPHLVSPQHSQNSLRLVHRLHIIVELQMGHTQTWSWSKSMRRPEGLFHARPHQGESMALDSVHEHRCVLVPIEKRPPVDLLQLAQCKPRSTPLQQGPCKAPWGVTGKPVSSVAHPCQACQQAWTEQFATHIFFFVEIKP